MRHITSIDVVKSWASTSAPDEHIRWIKNMVSGMAARNTAHVNLPQCAYSYVALRGIVSCIGPVAPVTARTDR